jgi:hypothetical protein
MTEETTAPPRDQAQNTYAISSATMGHDLVAALLGELRTMPDHWSRLNAELQQKIIDRVKDKTRVAIEKAVHLLVRGEFQAVPAKVEYVNRKGGIRAGLTVNGDALCRHALFDAAGANVLVVIADPKAWTERMDEIKAKGDQLELFDPSANYDPSVDQPGYRRDQDPYIRAGKSWQELKSSFGVIGVDLARAFEALLPDGAPRCMSCVDNDDDVQCGLKRDHEGPHKAPEAGDASEVPGDWLARALRERLAEHGVDVSLGTVQAWDALDNAAVVSWLDLYAADPAACKIERPSFLPPPQLPPAA